MYAPCAAVIRNFLDLLAYTLRPFSGWAASSKILAGGQGSKGLIDLWMGFF